MLPDNSRVAEQAASPVTLTPVPDEDSLTTRQAGLLLGVSVRTVQLWVERGSLSAWKTPGGHRRISRESVEQVLNNTTGQGRAPSPESLVSNTSEQPRPSSSDGRETLSVLIAEDDPRLRRLYELTFRKWELPIELRLVDNGFDALIEIGRKTPQLLIADLDMPGLDGFEMLRRIESGTLMTIDKVVVVTGLESWVIEAKGGLPDRVLLFSKPIPFPDLRSEVDSLMGSLAISR